MKKVARRLAFGTVALIATFGVVSLPSAADADSGWPTRTFVPHVTR